MPPGRAALVNSLLSEEDDEPAQPVARSRAALVQSLLDEPDKQVAPAKTRAALVQSLLEEHSPRPISPLRARSQEALDLAKRAGITPQLNREAMAVADRGKLPSADLPTMFPASSHAPARPSALDALGLRPAASHQPTGPSFDDIVAAKNKQSLSGTLGLQSRTPQAVPPVADDEAPFREWYATAAHQYGLDDDPDDPAQAYDYRAAFQAGATPDASGHWPSQFKRAGHPNEVVGGFNTRTGERVPGTPRLDEAGLIAQGWSRESAAHLASLPEDQAERDLVLSSDPMRTRAAVGADQVLSHSSTERIPAPPDPPTSIGDRLNDLGLTAVKGAMGVPETIVGLADLVTGGRAGQLAERAGFQPEQAKSILDTLYSPEQQAANTAVQQAGTTPFTPEDEAQIRSLYQAAVARGLSHEQARLEATDAVKAQQATTSFGRKLLAKGRAALENPSVIAHTVLESAPSMLMGGAVSRGLPVGGALLRGAIGEGVVGAGQTAEQIRQRTANGLLTPTQAAIAATTGVGTSAISLFGGRLAKTLGVADVDTLLAAAARDAGTRRAVVRDVVTGAVQEGFLEELPQSVQEQVLTNIALDRPLAEGVEDAAVMGALTGGAMGAGANVFSAVRGRGTPAGTSTPPKPPPPVTPKPTFHVEPTAPTVEPTPPAADTRASVPFLITKGMEADLRARGVSEADINAMTPAQAHEILAATPVEANLPPEMVPVGEEPAAAITPVRPVAENVVDRILEKVANGETLGSPEARAALDEKSRLERVREILAEPDEPPPPVAPVRDTIIAIDDAPPVEPMEADGRTRGSHVWQPGPEDDQRMRDLAARKEAEIRSGALLQQADDMDAAENASASTDAEATVSKREEPESPREFASTQINVPDDVGREIQSLGATIPDADLAEDGREDKAHVTVKFGLHADDPAALQALLKDEGPIRITFGKTSFFPNSESDSGDVLKVDIDSPDLHRLNQKIAAALPNTDTHPTYRPHATVAYLKPGLGKKYAGNDALAGKTMTIDRIVFSGKDRSLVEIPLTGTATSAAAVVSEPTMASDPVKRSPKAPARGNLQIRPKTYRGSDGFGITGKDPSGHSINVFTKSRESAEHIREKLRAGQDITTADFNPPSAGAAPIEKPSAPVTPKAVKTGEVHTAAVTVANRATRTPTAAERAVIFQPGNVVEGYAGRDTVVSYQPPTAEGRWSVTVKGEDGRVRTHSTEPRVVRDEHVERLKAAGKVHVHEAAKPSVPVVAKAEDERPSVMASALVQEPSDKPSPPVSAKGRSTTIRQLQHALARPGVTSNDLHGIFQTAGQDFDTATLKMGRTDPRWSDEIKQLGRASSRPSDKAWQVRANGVAEFFRLFVTDQTQAQVAAPTYLAEFTARLIEHPQLRKTLQGKVIAANPVPAPKGRVSGGGSATVGAEGGFTEDALPTLTGTVPTALTTTRLIELPEMVDLARELAQVPQVVKRFRGDRRLGDFDPNLLGGGRIRLHADLFKAGNEQQLAKTLAHEIGHLADWLPDYTLKRGNLIGRLRSMQGFLKGTFTTDDGALIKNTAVRAELSAVSKLWRGDWADGSPSYQAYRKSGKELYADALSMLLNNPGQLEARAPIFYRQFFEALDKKPDIKRVYFDLQEVLSGTREELIARRRAGVREMYSFGDTTALDLERLRRAEAEAARGNLATRLRIEMVDKNTPVIDRVKALEAKGVHINQDDDPRYALKELRYLGSLQEGFLGRTFHPVKTALDEAGISWTDFGEALFYERIIAGDRVDIANPRGITRPVALELLGDFRDGLTSEQRHVLNVSTQQFRAAVHEVAENAYDAGLYKPEMYQQMQDNPAYVSFRVIDHLEKNVTSKVHHQIGTLKDIQNPADATILKTLVTLRAIEFQKAKIKVFAAVEKHDSGDIAQAKEQGSANGRRLVDPEDKSQKLVTYYDQGRLRGKYVPIDVANTIENTSIGQNLAALEAIRLANGVWFRPVFTTVNLGFQASNFLRDFWRYWSNMKDASLASTLSRYWEARTLARVRAFGQPGTPSVRHQQAAKDWQEAKESRLLGVTFNDLLSGRPLEDTQIEELFIQHGMGGATTPSGVKGVLDWIKRTGDFIETLPKAAAIYEFRGAGSIADITPKQRAFIREKVGSPDFLIGGTLKPISNELFLFSNAITQAVRADFAVATDPETRGSFWRKTASAFMVPVMLTFAVEQFGHLLGGDDEDDDESGWRYVQRILRGVSEYDKTNYTILPLALDSVGNSVYLRLPRSDSGRLVSAILRKGLLAARGEADVMSSVAVIFDYMAGQVPGTTPALTLASDVVDYASGQNVYDDFRNREVFTRDEMDAGGLAKAKKFAGYEFQQMGGGIVYKFAAGEGRPTDQTAAQKILEWPILSNVVGRFLRITDYGHVEKARKVQADVRRDEARTRLDKKASVSDAVRLILKEPAASREKTADRLALSIVRQELKPPPTVADDAIRSRSEYDEAQKRLKMGVVRGVADPVTETVMSATSNAQKVAIILSASEQMSAAEFRAWMKQAVNVGVVSEAVNEAVVRVWAKRRPPPVTPK